MNSPANEYSVGNYRIDPDLGTISGPNGATHVSPKAMGVLLCLSRNAGIAVSRLDLEMEVWGADVSDQLATRCISELRHAFSDDASEPRYIETIHHRGYRLIAEVSTDPNSVPTSPTDAPEPKPEPTTLWQELQRRKVIRTALAYAAVAWLLIQFADTVFARISERATMILIALVMLGFPIAVFLAWILERTNRGMKFERAWERSERSAMLIRRSASVLMTSISVVAVVAATYILLSLNVGFTFENRDWVVVSHLENLTDDEVLDESLDRAFRVRLTQSGYVNLIPDALVQQTLVRMQQDASARVDRKLGIEIAIREDARAVITTSVSLIGATYSLTASIVDPSDDRVFRIQTVTTESRDNLLRSVERLADAIRTDLGEIEIERTNEPRLERVTTRSLEALSSYSIAVQQNIAGNHQAAIDLLHRAIEIDDEFASAYSQLGIILMNTGRPQTEFEGYFETALSLDDRLPEREKLRIQATSSWAETPDRAMRAWTLMTNVYPDDAIAHHNLGVVQLQGLNQGGAALESFGRAAELPNAYLDATLIYRGYSQLFVGQNAEALDSFKEAFELSGNPQNFALSDGYVVNLEYENAQEFLDSHSDMTSRYSRMLRLIRLTIYHIDRGQMEAALDAIDDTVMLFELQEDRPALEYRMVRLGVLEAMSDVARFEQELSSGLEDIFLVLRLQSPPISSFFYLHPILRTAAIAARNGRVDDARTIYDAPEIIEAIHGYPVRIAMHRVLGAEIVLATGDVEEAISILRDSLNTLETFEAHAVLARAYEAAGNVDAALQEYEWIRDHRGRAFSEWHEDLLGRELNIIEWARAAYRMGVVHEAAANQDLAQIYFRQFAKHWEQSDADIEDLGVARARITVDQDL